MSAKIKHIWKGNVSIGKETFSGVGDEKIVSDPETIQKCLNYKIRSTNGAMVDRFQVEILEELVQKDEIAPVVEKVQESLKKDEPDPLKALDGVPDLLPDDSVKTDNKDSSRESGLINSVEGNDPLQETEKESGGNQSKSEKIPGKKSENKKTANENGTDKASKSSKK